MSRSRRSRRCGSRDRRAGRGASPTSSIVRDGRSDGVHLRSRDVSPRRRGTLEDAERYVAHLCDTASSYEAWGIASDDMLQGLVCVTVADWPLLSRF